MKKILIVLVCLVLVGCGLCPAYMRSQSDYMKVSNIAIGGASKSRVKMMFGEPDSKEVYEDKSEKWIYKNREDNKTIVFLFTPSGAVGLTQIIPPEGVEQNK
ncbi:MAG: hypothetical protein PHI86_00190 [Candidatus Omnitrophica bacterium]|nr:hypothetical protein [Candidatus Omnitrophota bacterium]HOX54482.1 hypothetical protein [Candidatus Omnitrophota bacterium]